MPLKLKLKIIDCSKPLLNKPSQSSYGSFHASITQSFFHACVNFDLSLLLEIHRSAKKAVHDKKVHYPELITKDGLETETTYLWQNHKKIMDQFNTQKN